MQTGNVVSPATPLESLPGITPRRARLLHELGLSRLIDLLEYFPRDYQFEAAEGSTAQLVQGQIHTVRGEVVACDYLTGRGKPRFEATLDDGAGKLALVWFNGSFWRRTIHPGLMLRVRGRVRFFRGMPQMVNPATQRLDPRDPAPVLAESRLVPVYRANADLKSPEIQSIIAQQLAHVPDLIEEFWPESLLRRRSLMSRPDAYRAMHQPRDRRHAEQARRRLVYDELMLMQLGLGLSKRLRAGGLSAPILRIDRTVDSRIRARFPFDLTTAQTRAIHEILRDLRSGRPMHRLLQGDVGSGKTAVAVYAMLLAVANKMQSAVLAPTEVLAEQHYLTLTSLLSGSRVNVGLLTQRSKRESRGSIARAVADGSIHLVVGTQAMIQQDVEFANLGLVVVDEQHRFGVRQRAILKTKGLSPHYLVMTATPIPRTLALSYFADFDLSVIDELPPGRRPVKTSFFRQDQSGPAFAFVREQIAAGRQAFVVVPQIEDNPADDTRSVKSEFDRLARTELSGLRLTMLHGAMPTDEKQRVMQDFRRHRYDALVATTVIEVGIDVPNATVIVIESAERFGIAQLHQLRGRVGRGEHPGFCIFLSDATSDDALARLNALCRTHDGFKVAELDLTLRGPGDFFGVRQSGLPPLKLADITQELSLLEICRDDARELLAADPTLREPAQRVVRNALAARFGDALGLAQVG